MGEFLEAEGEAAPDAAVVSDSAGVGIALERARARRGGKGADAADRFLAAQEALIADQRRHLHEQLRTLGLDHWSKRLRLGFQVLTLVFGVGVVAVIGAMAFDASRADGVVIRPFSVPPELAQRGVTGEAVASQLLDRLTDITDKGHIGAPTAKVEAGWGHEIKVEIPETGVSLSQVDQWLREKLGHQQALTGDVSRTPEGALVLDARLSGHPFPTQTGAPTDLPQMITRLAEAAYARQQPMGFADYLLQMGRIDEMAAHARQMTDSHDPVVRAYGWGSMGVAADDRGNEADAVRFFNAALAEGVGLSWPDGNLAQIDWRHGREEVSYQHMVHELPLIARDTSNNAQAVGETRLDVEAYLAQYRRDHATALAKRLQESLGDNLGRANSRASLQVLVAFDRALAHDGARGEADALAFAPRWPADVRVKAEMLWRIALAREDWAAMVSRIDAYEALPGIGPEIVLEAYKALALAKLGRIAEAEALMADAPADCQTCLRARAAAAEAAGRHAEADQWFAQASRLAPSLPSAPVEWGRSLLERGEPARAAAQFTEVLRRSPRAEEGMVGLGEALLAQGDAAGAIQQFAAADKLTPLWGRLHLKWGQALARHGKAQEARAQFAKAAGLDLTPDERVELSKASHG